MIPHTSAPWVVVGTDLSIKQFDKPNNAVGSFVARVHPRGEKPTPEAIGNAKILAEAPSFYSTARAIVAAWDHDEIGQIDGSLIDELRDSLNRIERE